ncbi:unnamed protein product [Callosobruchus maculatus]|uniref:MSP domain-containing protein n=1 Tax=Callosobruchus maculatus TaxID=64391 RepID=A0A653D8X3_CALMS|nr:unnamed protein product [Callosobruchus maculatus]
MKKIRLVFFQVKISLQLEEEHKLLEVIGVGRNSRSKKPFIQRAPEKSTKFYKLPVILSHNYIRINPMLTWSTQRRMIFIRNYSKDTIYQFDFPEQTIYGVINITSHPTFGFLKPKETQTVIITIKTYNEPAVLNYNYTCYIMNYNALFLHRKTIYKDATAEVATPEDKIIISVFLEHSHQTVQRSICRGMSTTPIYLRSKESTKSSVSQSTIPSS